ncbi:hypothetical protein PGB90_004599 [Kerria lacca]
MAISSNFLIFITCLSIVQFIQLTRAKHIVRELGNTETEIFTKLNEGKTELQNASPELTREELAEQTLNQLTEDLYLILQDSNAELILILIFDTVKDTLTNKDAPKVFYRIRNKIKQFLIGTGSPQNAEQLRKGMRQYLMSENSPKRIERFWKVMQNTIDKLQINEQSMKHLETNVNYIIDNPKTPENINKIVDNFHKLIHLDPEITLSGVTMNGIKNISERIVVIGYVRSVGVLLCSKTRVNLVAIRPRSAVKFGLVIFPTYSYKLPPHVESLLRSGLVHAMAGKGRARYASS